MAIDEDTFWVMGGLGEFEALNDVWEFTIEEPKDGMPLSKIKAHKLQDSQPGGNRWIPRCMFSASISAIPSGSAAAWIRRMENLQAISGPATSRKRVGSPLPNGHKGS